MRKNKLINYARKILEKHDVKPIYIMISGAHLYGFPSKDSDYDIRCTHIIPTTKLFHLKKPKEVIEHSMKIDGVEIDLVSFEIEKTINLILNNNSNVLEQITGENLNPTIEHKELVKLAKNAISKKVYNPYKGMALQNYKKFIESKNAAYECKAVKKYLYILRSYMAGINALRTGDIEPNINNLNKKFKLSIVNKLVELKKKEERKVLALDVEAEKAIAKLRAGLELALQESKLPETPKNIEELDKYLFKVRLKFM